MGGDDREVGNLAASWSTAAGGHDAGSPPFRRACRHPCRSCQHRSDRDLEAGDRLEQRVQPGVVDRVVPHDGVEVEAEDPVPDAPPASASAMAASPFKGSTAPPHPDEGLGVASEIRYVAARAGGGTRSELMSKATSTASTPAASRSATTSSSVRATHGFDQTARGRRRRVPGRRPRRRCPGSSAGRCASSVFPFRPTQVGGTTSPHERCR